MSFAALPHPPGRTLGVLTLTLALSASPACREPEPEDPALLTLDEQVVHLSQFLAHASQIEEAGETRLDGQTRQAVLESFIEERVVVLEAIGQGLLGKGAGPEEEAEAVRRLLAATALRSVVVSEEDVEAYYVEHAEEFRLPETVTLRQILVPTRNEARDLRRRLIKDRRSFESLARSQSRSPDAADGGLMGTFSRGQLPPELEEAAFSLRPGATSSLLQTAFGYHVLRVDARQAPREATLEECRDQIRALLMEQESDRRVRQFVRDLLARAKVNHEAVQALTPIPG